MGVLKWLIEAMQGNQTTEQSFAASRQTVFGPHIMVRLSAQSIGDQTELANGALRFLLRTIDLSANAGKVRREWPSRH
jgi:hypothetical protein